MVTNQYAWSSCFEGATQPWPSDRTPSIEQRPRPRRLRVYLVGSQADTQNTVDTLHVLGYAEQFE